MHFQLMGLKKATVYGAIAMQKIKFDSVLQIYT